MEVKANTSDDYLSALFDVSDKIVPDQEPVAQLSPRVFEDGLAQEGTYMPFTNPDTGETLPVLVQNSHDPEQKRVRFSGPALDHLQPGSGGIIGNFDPDMREERDANMPASLQDYKEFLKQKILKGSQDLTYGPGSPNPTGADMKEFVGARDNRLRTGQVALSPSDYNLFSPQEREELGIADKRGQPNTEGMVERYYGPEARGKNLRDIIDTYPKLAGDPTAGAIGAASGGMPTMVSKDQSGNSLWSDGSRVFSDGTIARPLGNMMKFTSKDGKVRYAPIDPMKQPIPPVPTGLTFDSPQEQKDAALNQLSQQDQIAVREYAANTRGAQTRQGRTDPAYVRLSPYVKLLDKDHDPSVFPIRQQVRMQWNSTSNGMPGQKIDSFNQALTHAGLMWELVHKLPGGEVRNLNQAKNYIRKNWGGDDAVTNFEQMMEYLASETSRGLRGGVPNEGDITRIITAFNESSSKEQLEGAIKKVMTKTIEGGLKTMASGYKARLKQDVPDDMLLYDDTKEALRKIGFTTFAGRKIANAAGDKAETPTAKSYPTPSQASIAALIADSSNSFKRKVFDQTYGPGASSKVLGNE